jgi:alcohol dehydrogenase
MKALVYLGPGQRAWETKPKPTIRERGDAIIRITKSTICGTDLHILKGDVPSVTPGRILGHEGVGVIEAVVLLSDILPTAYECGVLNGEIQPGDTVAIVGAGPIGLAALLTAQLYSPSAIVMVDLDANRLNKAQAFGATSVVNSAAEDAVARVLAITDSAGVDLAIEAVGTPAAFDTCQAIVGAGGRIANIGVHGKPVQLHLEKLWDRNIALTTRLVDTVTTPLLLKLVQTGKLRPAALVTHRFGLDDIMQAYDTFADAAKTSALKVVLEGRGAK